MQTPEQSKAAAAARRRHLRLVDDLPEPGHIPDFHQYDLVVVNSSGGKDSSVTAWWVLRVALAQCYSLDRVVVLHADLGTVEWSGTQDVARAQAEHLGLAFHVCTRIGGRAPRPSEIYEKGEEWGDMLDYALRRGRWFAFQQRYCTSEFKRSPCANWIKAYCRRRFGRTTKVRVLNAMGMRSQESPGREKMEQFETNKRANTKTVTLDNWLPVKHWTERQVWSTIEREGLPKHYAYALGMPRLSCCFCIFAPRAVLKLAAKHNRELLDKYIEVEDALNHAFTMTREKGKPPELIWLRDIRDELDAGDDHVDTDALRDGAWDM